MSTRLVATTTPQMTALLQARHFHDAGLVAARWEADGLALSIELPESDPSGVAVTLTVCPPAGQRPTLEDVRLPAELLRLELVEGTAHPRVSLTAVADHDPTHAFTLDPPAASLHLAWPDLEAQRALEATQRALRARRFDLEAPETLGLLDGLQAQADGLATTDPEAVWEAVEECLEALLSNRWLGQLGPGRADRLRALPVPVLTPTARAARDASQRYLTRPEP